VQVKAGRLKGLAVAATQRSRFASKHVFAEVNRWRQAAKDARLTLE
jgi:hypothetical protein